MALRDFVIKRLITGVITIIVVVIFNFFLFRFPVFLWGITPADLYINPQMPAETQERLRELWGIPPRSATFEDWLNHFQRYFVNLLTFNFAYSFKPFRPVIELIVERLPNTLILMGVSTILAIVIGIIAGVYAASRHGRKLDIALVTVSLTIWSVPIFWLGLILILIFGFYLGLFPVTGGTISPPPYTPKDPFGIFLDYLWHLTLPALTLTISGFGGWLLLMRNSLIDVLTEDYIVTARAKGLDEKTVLFRHAVRNAMLPVVTSITLSLATLWSGAVLTETVFNWYGMGRLIVEALLAHNWPVADAVFYLMAISVVLANIIADILYAILDPRVRY